MKRRDTVEDHKNKITLQRRKTVKIEDKEQSDGFGTVHSIYTKKQSERTKRFKNYKYKTKRKSKKTKKVEIIRQDEKIGHGRVMCKNHSSSVIS